MYINKIIISKVPRIILCHGSNMCLNVNFDGTTIRLERQVNKSDALRNCDLPDDLCHMNVFECTH